MSITTAPRQTAGKRLHLGRNSINKVLPIGRMDSVLLYQSECVSQGDWHTLRYDLGYLP